MGKRRTGWKLPPLSLPVALLGANVSGKANFFTIVWFTMLQGDPPLLGAAMGRTYHTRKGIGQTGTFSLNIPPARLAQVVDYCGLHSGSKVDKSSLFDLFYGELGTAPMIMDCLLNVECRFKDSMMFDTMELIIGEIVEIYCEEECISGDEPDFNKMDSLLFLMPQGPYFQGGRPIAEAFAIGRDYRPDR